MGSFRIRPIEDRDAATATRLCAELGYSVEESAVLARVGQIAGDPNRAVLVACVADAVVGWIDLSVEYHLQSEPAALIGGLVVSEATRGQGIGRLLCEAAEAWAQGRGIGRMRGRGN